MFRLLWSPLRFFEERLSGPPRLWRGLAFPAACALFDLFSVVVLTRKISAELSTLALAAGLSPGAFSAARWPAFLTVLGYPMHFALSVVIIVSLDVMLKDSRQHRRLVELIGLAFAAFLPGAVMACVVSLGWSAPSAGGLLVSLPESAARYGQTLATDPWLSTVRVFYYFGLMWYCALLAAILNVAGILRPQAAAAITPVLFVALGGFRLVAAAASQP